MTYASYGGKPVTRLTVVPPAAPGAPGSEEVAYDTLQRLKRSAEELIEAADVLLEGYRPPPRPRLRVVSGDQAEDA